MGIFLTVSNYRSTDKNNCPWQSSLKSTVSCVLQLATMFELPVKTLGIALSLTFVASSVLADPSYVNPLGAIKSVSSPLAQALEHAKRGQACIARGDLPAAVQELNLAVQMAPDCVAVRVCRGRALSGLRKYEAAIADFSMAIAMNAESSVALIGRADAWFQSGHSDKAIADLTEVIRLNPSKAGGYVSRAMVYAAQGDYGSAEKDLSTALQYSTADLQAYSLRAQVKFANGDSDGAIADLHTVVKLAPAISDSYYNRAAGLLRVGRLDEAIADLNKTIALKPDDWAAMSDRAVVLIKIGRYEEALVDYDHMLEREHHDVVALAGKALLLAGCPSAALRDGALATDLALDACEISQYKDVGGMIALAAACAELGHFSRAIKLQLWAIERSPPATAAALRDTLQLYRDNRPYRFKPVGVESSTANAKSLKRGPQ